MEIVEYARLEALSPTSRTRGLRKSVRVSYNSNNSSYYYYDYQYYHYHHYYFDYKGLGLGLPGSGVILHGVTPFMTLLIAPKPQTLNP